MCVEQNWVSFVLPKWLTHCRSWNQLHKNIFHVLAFLLFIASMLLRLIRVHISHSNCTNYLVTDSGLGTFRTLYGLALCTTTTNHHRVVKKTDLKCCFKSNAAIQVKWLIKYQQANLPLPWNHLVHYSSGVIFSNGNIWKQQRRFALSTLKYFGFGKKSLEPVILDEFTHCAEKIKAYKGEHCTQKQFLTEEINNL